MGDRGRSHLHLELRHHGLRERQQPRAAEEGAGRAQLSWRPRGAGAEGGRLDCREDHRTRLEGGGHRRDGEAPYAVSHALREPERAALSSAWRRGGCAGLGLGVEGQGWGGLVVG
jgi:hypothetical protein